MSQIIGAVAAFGVVLYMAFGGFAAHLYGLQLRGNILLNLEFDPMMQIVLVAVYFTVVFSFPLLFHPFRAVIEELLHQWGVPLDEICASRSRMGMTVVLLLSQMLVAIGVPGIEVVFGLAGASSCLGICFVFPTALFAKLYPWHQHRHGPKYHLLLWVIVAVFTWIGMTATWKLLTGH